MRISKTNKGITLVALIITVIVLLILAVVTINAINGDGIIGHAKNAADSYEEAEQNELEYQKYVYKELGYEVDSRIIYNLNGGSFTETPVEEYKEGTVVGFISPVKEGYSFEGWYLSSVFSGNALYRTTTSMKGDIQLYAKWLAETDEGYFTYTVSSGSATITGFTETGLAAYNNGELATLVLPKTDGSGNNVVAVGTRAFNSSYAGVETLVIHEGITKLNDYSLSGYTGIKKLTMPISLSFSAYAFKDCTGIEKVTFTKGTGTGNAFNSSPSYSYTPWYMSRTNTINVEFEEGITSIGNYMFYSCTGLQMVKLPSTLTSIGDSVFRGCTGMSSSLELPEGLTSIGSYAFRGCTGLTGTIKIPEGVTKINSYTFYNCSGIEKLVLHDGITTLDSYAFSGCSGIKELTMPISLAYSQYVFQSCTSIEKVTFTKGTGVGNAFNSNPSHTYTPWYLSRANTINVEFEEGITSIGRYMFYGCTGLQMVVLPSTLTSIGDHVFYGCTGMTGNFELPEGLTSIGSYAFHGCAGLTGTIKIPEGVTKINSYTFYNCSGIEKLVLHDGITTLDSYAFSGCSEIKELTMPISLAYSQYVFQSCTSIEKVTFTKGTGVGNAFSSSPSFSYTPWYLSRANTINVELEEGITSIGTYMFKNCTGLQKVILPSTLTSIGKEVFYGITSPTYYFRGTEAQWSSVTIGTNNSSLTTPTYNYSN